MNFSVGKLTKDWADRSQLPAWYEPTTTSTNHIAKTNVIAEDPVTLYLTDHQTAGRGRGDHTWTNPGDGDQRGHGLLSSWVFQMRRAPQPILSPAIGLAVWNTFSTSFPWLAWSLKAPNDLYLGPNKIAGLLIESVQNGSSHRLVVGFGFNVWKAPSQIEAATYLTETFEEGLLTESTWFHILDRLLLEISLAVSQTSIELSPMQQKSLLHALNQFPKLELPYQKIEKDGSLWKGDQKINWSEL